MTLQQVNWAMEHDWYYYTGTCSVSGVRVVYVRCDMTAGKTLEFTDFTELRNWAGY